MGLKEQLGCREGLVAKRMECRRSNFDGRLMVTIFLVDGLPGGEF